MKADLHVHSRYSRDAISSPRAIFRVAKRKGIDVLAITDHESTAGWSEMREEAEESGVGLILGQEKRVYYNGRTVGELLCLFLSEPVQSQEFRDIIQEVEDQEGIVSVAHPFDGRRPKFKVLDLLVEWDVAVEVFNSRCYGRRGNGRALKYAVENGAMMTAGSDAHTPFELGNAYLEVDIETPEGLKGAIKRREAKVFGAASNPLFSFYSAVGRLGWVHS